MQRRKLKIVVLMGGPSVEHEISLRTGSEILKNLDEKKYVVHPVVITKKKQWLFLNQETKMLSFFPRATAGVVSEQEGVKAIREERPDVAVIAMHGSYGEDGVVQGLLEAAGVPYTGSGVLASALGMDKPRSYAVFKHAGLLVPDFAVVRRAKDLPVGIKRWGWPVVVKPTNHGSSLGVHIANNAGKLREGIRDAQKFSRDIILQKFILGKELTCGVLEIRNKLTALPPMEIIPKLGAFYDYRSKYADGGSEHVVNPSWMPRTLVREIQRSAAVAHHAIGCAGMSRTDFILGNDGRLYTLEINTIPGMTPTSLLPEAARSTGIDFQKLLDILIINALQKRRKK